MSDSLATALCGALAAEIRDVRALIDALAEVLTADEYLALNYTEQLQSFDLLAQRAQESADLLERIAAGMRGHDAVEHVRLELMQARLRDVLMATNPKLQPDARPIIIRKVKKVVGGGHHGGAWKVAYADFVTAMMAFFMLLWLLADPDQEKLRGLAEYFSPSSAAGKPGETIESDAGEAPGLGGRTRRAQSDNPQTNGQPTSEAATQGTARGGTASVPDASMRVMAEELKLLLQPVTTPKSERQSVSVEKSRDGIRVSLMDDSNRSMFRPGTAVLNDYARAMLTQVAKKIAKSGIQVAIEGHTDATGGQSDANWRLSADRALAARAALIAGGMTPDRFSEVVALAATQPVYPDQPERAENRRITIVLLAEQSPLPSDVSFRF
jgi:chemotaxis protein MotB